MTTFQYRYLIALGSNTGPRLNLLKAAISNIHLSIGPVTAQSPIYETEPMGVADSLFLNGALIVESSIPPLDVMEALLLIEKKLGRIRTEKWGNRTIDLDLLLCEEKNQDGAWSPVVLNAESLSLPHPEMLVRTFVMMPAVDIAGDWQHPVEQRTLGVLISIRFDEKELLSVKPVTFSL